MLYILIAVLMFGLLVALHELGHFVAAKLCGVKVNEFAIGMGPQILHRKKGETEYSLRLLPIGGFCAMEGEEEGASADPRAFPNRPWWQRLIILLAGVFMNFLTGLAIIFCLFAGAKSFATTEITQVLPDAQAAQSLQAGDRILSVDGHAVYLRPDISLFLSRVSGEDVDLTVEREGRKLELTVPLTTYTDEETKTQGKMLGITLNGWEDATLGVKLRNTWYQALDYARLVWVSLGDLVQGKVKLRDMSGVVEITHMMAQAGEQGAQEAIENQQSPLIGALRNILDLVAFIAVNLAVMNLLPIPALDGGQIFFMAINGILIALRGKPLDPKYQGWVTAAGFACLMALMLAVTVSDVFKLFGR